MRSVMLSLLSEQAAIEVAAWFEDDDEGQRRFGGFYGVHPRWWSLVEDSTHRQGYIATIEGLNVGFIDLEQDEATVHLSIYVRKERRGERLSGLLLKYGIEQARLFRDAVVLVAEVEPDNEASLSACRNAGFVDQGQNRFGDLVLTFPLR